MYWSGKKKIKLTVGACRRVNRVEHQRKDVCETREMILGSWAAMTRLKFQCASECVTMGRFQIFICVGTKIKAQWVKILRTVFDAAETKRSKIAPVFKGMLRTLTCFNVLIFPNQ